MPELIMIPGFDLLLLSAYSLPGHPSVFIPCIPGGPQAAEEEEQGKRYACSTKRDREVRQRAEGGREDLDKDTTRRLCQVAIRQLDKCPGNADQIAKKDAPAGEQCRAQDTQ